jgi:hypothetical protein
MPRNETSFYFHRWVARHQAPSPALRLCRAHQLLGPAYRGPLLRLAPRFVAGYLYPVEFYALRPDAPDNAVEMLSKNPLAPLESGLRRSRGGRQTAGHKQAAKQSGAAKDVPQGLNRLRKKCCTGQESKTSGAKALIRPLFTARLKSCPDTKHEFFHGL